MVREKIEPDQFIGRKGFKNDSMKGVVLKNIIVALALVSLTGVVIAQEIPKQEKVKEIIIKVNDNWQRQHPSHGRAFWDNAAYHTGNMAAYAVTAYQPYLNFSEAWAEKNKWKGAKSDNKSQWKYNYGETDEHVLFGDWQICFQTYIDIFNYTGSIDSLKIARATEVMEYQMSTTNNDYWWWADGLYMVMPVMSKLYKVTGDQLYLNKLYEYYTYAKSIMYDEETGLFYRDIKYIYPKHKSLNGKKDFWARGDGWVFAGLAKVLNDLPGDCKYRSEFIQVYKKMANTLIGIQQPDGYWTRSMLDPEHAPGPETSGTAFYTFGLLWGINNGILERDEYLNTALKGWNYLCNTAVDANGNVGYVQPIGERAIPGQVVDKNSTANFGVGAMLLAASEMYKLSGK